MKDESNNYLKIIKSNLNISILKERKPSKPKDMVLKKAINFMGGSLSNMEPKIIT